jgi:hypothetical protein
MSLTPTNLLSHEGNFYIMALCPVFADYWEEHGMVLPDEMQNFIYFEGEVNAFPRKNAKEPQWAFTVSALTKNKASFMLYPEHFSDCFCYDDDIENLILYTRGEMDKLYKEANRSDDEEK